MKVLKYSLGQLQANCYLLVEEKNCLIVDVGDEAGFILEKIQQMNLRPVAILTTHGHFDHNLGAGEIQLSFNIPYYVGKKDLFLIKRLNETAVHFLGYDTHSIQPKNIKYFSGNELEIENWKLKIIHVPGHTPGSCAFYFPEEDIVFTGDVLFKEAIGRYDFSYSDKNLLKQSLKKLFLLPEQTTVYPGHGDETFIGNELNSEFF